MIYKVKSQGRVVMVEGPAGEDLKAHWQEFIDNIAEVVGDQPSKISPERPEWEKRRARYLRALMYRHTGQLPREVKEIDVFLAMIARYGFHDVTKPETVTLA